MKNQETNNKDSNQETGCTIFFQNGTSQFAPGANLKQLMNVLKAGVDSGWLVYGNSILI